MTGPASEAAAIAVVVLGVLASLSDLRTRRIPNSLTLGAAIVAPMFFGVIVGWHAALWSVAGWCMGLLLFLPLFLLRGMGAGDVKLLAAFGAWLGPAGAWWVAIYGGIAGGAIAIPWLLWRGALGRTLSNAWALLGFWRLAGLRPHPELTVDSPRALRLPYAVPLAVGACATLWLRS
jgi:prepilin peptidase CpaA